MRQAFARLLTLIMLATAWPVAAGENQTSPGQELGRQCRRRELLHQQLREMLASPDADMQRLGIVFHALGNFDRAELTPLVRQDRHSAWAALQALESAPQSEEVTRALISRLASDPEWGEHYAAEILDRRVPGWRDRPEVDQAILQLLDRVGYADEEVRAAACSMLTILGPRLAPHVPRLLTLAEEESEPAEAGRVLRVIPWNALGDQRDEVVRRVSALLLRHQSRSLDWDIWNAWREWPGRLTEAELDPLLREALRFRESDSAPDYSIQDTLGELTRTLDGNWPGWRERPVVLAAIQQLRAETRHADAARRQCGLGVLISLGETRQPELRDYLLKQVLSDKPEEWEEAAWLLDAVAVADLDLRPEDRQRLLQHWLKLLDSPPSARWRTALDGLSWLGPEAKSAVPRLLCQMERMLWDDAETWREQPANAFEGGLTYDPEDFGIALTEIEPGWKKTLAGRRIATLVCDRIQWQVTHGMEDDVEGWEGNLWEQFGWATPGLRSAALDRMLFAMKDDPDDYLPAVDMMAERLDELCPGWHESPEARKHWRRLEPDFPWADDPGRNRLFLRLTLHHSGLSRERKREYLLEALAAGLCLGREFQAALDRFAPAWPESPQAREATPKIVERFAANLDDDEAYPDLDCWRMLKRLGAAGQCEYPLLLRLWVDAEELDAEELADLQLPTDAEALSRRLRELRPDYWQSPQVRRYRQRMLSHLVDEDEDVRSEAFHHCFRPELLACRSQEDFQRLPELLARLARCKEAEEEWERTDDEGKVIPRPGPRASRLLWQLRHTIRQRKILDGPILLPSSDGNSSNQ